VGFQLMLRSTAFKFACGREQFYLFKWEPAQHLQRIAAAGGRAMARARCNCVHSHWFRI